MKEIVITWKQLYYNMPRVGQLDNYYGLGDNIRGTLALYRLCKHNNYNVEIDTHLHPVSYFLKNRFSRCKEYIEDNSDAVHFFPKTHSIEADVKNFLHDKSKILCMSNCDFDARSITESEKKFITNLLEPTSEVRKEVDTIVANLPQDYSILHCRFRDENVEKPQNKSIHEKINLLKRQSDVVMSNCNIFKKQCGLPYIDTSGGHIGYEDSLSKLKDTLIDFYVLTRSREIRTYSEYDWISGYAFWASVIYDVPLINIKDI
jgi:hypothetical protein